MSFVADFDALPWERLLPHTGETRTQEILPLLRRSRLDLADFARLLSPAASCLLESLCQKSHQVTAQRFGKVIRLFAPLYLSNECINNCDYCGFSRDNPIFRVTLSPHQIQAETLALKAQGFRNILLVAGEHPRFISGTYLEEAVRVVHAEVPGVSLEVGPMEAPEYAPLVRAGAEGLVVYQETYDRSVYAAVHRTGPKRNFEWRLDTPERAYAAGFRRLGIGALFGLSDWRLEAISVAAHASYLLKHCWKAQLSVSLPRLRPCAGEFEPKTSLSNRHLVQLIAAFRLFLPDVGLVLSTREPAQLRDGLIPLGVTLMSAGSHTEPGGYTGAGNEQVHQTVRGKIIPVPLPSEATRLGQTGATQQFEIADERSPVEVARAIRARGYEPVWKDWDDAAGSQVQPARSNLEVA